MVEQTKPFSQSLISRACARYIYINTQTVPLNICLQDLFHYDECE